MIRDDFMSIAKELGIGVETVSEDGVEALVFNVDGECGIYHASVVCLEAESLFVCTINLGIKIAEEKLTEAAAYLLGRNYNYIFASANIDPESRLALTRCPIVVRGSDEERRDLIRAAMYQASAMADAEYKGIAAFV